MIIDSVVIILIITVAKQTRILLCLVILRILTFIFVLNATISNISAISWRPVLVVEEAEVHRENHRP